jgi:hypothetical protein
LNKAAPQTPRPLRLAWQERIALAALASAAVVIVPGGLNRFVFGKLALAAIGVLASLAVQAHGRLGKLPVCLLTCAGLVMGLAVAAGENPHAQLVGLPPRYEGLIALPIYLGGLLAGVRLLGPDRTNGSTAFFLRWMSIASLAIGAVAMLEALHLDVLPGTGSRPGSLLGNASDEGAWAVLCLGPLTATAIAGHRPLHVVGATFALAALICAESRGALLGALAMAGMLFVLLPTPRQRLVLSAAVVGMTAMVLGIPASRERVTGTEHLASMTARGRLLLTREAARMVAASPVTGYGPSGFVDELPREHTAEYEREIGPADPPDSPHDWLLQAAVAGGIVLALLAVALAGLTILRGWRGLVQHPTVGEAQAYAGLLAGLVGYSIALLFHFTSPGTTPLAAVFAGALLARRPGSHSLERAQRLSACTARAITAGAVALLIAVLGASAVAEIPLREGINEAAAGHVRAASRRFAAAEGWRPWDIGVATLATHVFATLADRGIANGAAAGMPWVKKALAGDPRSAGVLADAVDIAEASHDDARALVLVSRALALDPRNPALLARRRELLP